MKNPTLKKIIEYIKNGDQGLNKKEVIEDYDGVLSWIVQYFRMFIGEEDYRGSPVAIFYDVKTYASFKKWLKKHFMKKITLF